MHLNLVRQVTATTGTGTLTLGAAVPSFLTMAQAGAVDGRTYTYSIEDGEHREIGRGVYTASGTTLTRNVLNSTNNDDPINLSGNAEVFITVAAEDFGSETRVISGAASITRADLNGLARLTGGTYALTYEAAADLGSDFTHTLACEATAVTLTPDGVEKIRVNGADEDNLAVVTGQFGRVWSDGTKLFASVLPSTGLFDNSFGESGYQKLPGGLIIQWMTVTAGVGTSGNVSWPIAFPNAVQQVVCAQRVAGEAARGAHVRDVSASTVDVHRWFWNKLSTSDAIDSGAPVAVIAIGD